MPINVDSGPEATDVFRLCYLLRVSSCITRPFPCEFFLPVSFAFALISKYIEPAYQCNTSLQCEHLPQFLSSFSHYLYHLMAQSLYPIRRG